MPVTQILLTRPQDKSEQLAEQLAAHGIKSCVQSLLQLTEVDVSKAQLSVLESADIVVFVSQDAARYLQQAGAELNRTSICLAVGKSTAEVVEELFDKPCASPIVETSEGLLALPELNSVSQKQIVLVKGKGGRTKLAAELKSREAILHPLSVYQRLPHPDVTEEMVKVWQKEQVDSLVLTSNTSIDVFLALVKDKNWLKEISLFLVSERCVDYVEQQKIGFKKIINCQGADNKRILAAIVSENTKKQSNAMEQEKDITTQSSVAEKPVTTSQPKNTEQPKANSNSGKGIAWIALVVSLSSVAALGFGYTLYLKQQNAISSLNQEKANLITQLASTESKIEGIQQQRLALLQQSELSQNALSQQISDAELALNEQINQQLVLAKQQTPELNKEEVKSLYRMAEFKAYVQQDYLGAAGMLQRLDILLENFSGTQQARTALHADIQLLQSIEKVDVETAYLTLNGLTSNLESLPLNMVELPDEAEINEQDAISNDVSDWQANLKRSWKLLVDDFIKVRKRKGAVEPLLSAEEQALIRHQLRFYLVQAQTALLEKQKSIFNASLGQANEVIKDYYNSQDPRVQHLVEQLETLLTLPLNFTPEVSFSSEQNIKELL